MEKSLKECLNEAADLIETSGWCRRDFEKSMADGPHFCLVGAINAVCPTTGEAVKKGDNKILSQMGFSSTEHIYEFNDKYAKDKRTVIRRMRQIAKSLPDEAVTPINCA